MKKTLIIVLVTLFAIVAFGTRTASAQETKKEKAAVTEKKTRWHGTLIRINAGESTLQVRKGSTERTIHYTDATKWTKAKKAIAMSDVKEGADVICLGTANEKGDFVATQVDVRRE